MATHFLSFVTYVCVFGSIIALVLINISGSTNNFIIDRFYFSEINDHFRWTLYGLCMRNDNAEFRCTVPRPAYPYSPLDNFGTTGVPQEFITNRNTYYYFSRIAYGFYLVALLFTVLTVAYMLFKHCSMSYRRSIPSTTSSFLAFVSAIMASSLNSVAHIKGVQVYNSDGFHASLGRDMFLCMWVSVGLLLITSISLGMMSRIEYYRSARRTGVVYTV